MANVIRVECEGYDEFYLNVDTITTMGLLDVQLSQGQTAKACMVRLASGGSILFPPATFPELRDALMGTNKRYDIDIPDSILKSFNDEQDDD